MRVNSLQVKNFRSFQDSGVIDLDSINVLVGANNAGKSSILRGLYHVQEGLGVILDDVRVGSNSAYIELSISDARAQEPFQTLGYDFGRLTVSLVRKDDGRSGGAAITFRPHESDSRERVSLS